MRVSVRCIGWTFFLILFFGNTAPATESAPPIVIGGTLSMEGRYQEPAMMAQKAFRLWVDEVNREGGLLGRQVKLIIYDDKSDPQRTRMLYQRLIERDKADILLSPYSTPLTLAAASVSEVHQMLMMAIGAAAEKPWQGGARFLFQLYAPANREFIGLLDMMAKQNLRTLSVLYDQTSEFNLDIVSGVQAWADIFKINIVFREGYRDGKTDLPGLLATVKAKDANGLLLSAYSPDCHELLRLLRDMDYRPTVLAMPVAPVLPGFPTKAGDMADRVFGPSHWEPDERIPFPGTREFIDSFTRFAGHPPSFHAASAYSACQIMENAITWTQSIDNRKLRDYIAALDTVTIFGRFKVDPTGKQVGHNSFIIQWQNGKKEIVWPQKMQTAKPVF